MDYPKSVPGVGLVDGRFVDEDVVTGQVGSLIPSAWGNAVTDEILNVIESAGLDPEEGRNDQLLMALGGISVELLEGGQIPVGAGLVLLSAGHESAGYILPAATGSAEITLRRVDVSQNALVITVQGDDMIYLETTEQAAGQTQTELIFSGDYLRLRSDGKGGWWCTGQAVLPPEIETGLVVFSAPGSVAWKVPAVLRSGRKKARVQVIGGGGGGGRISTAAGGGGGGGGYAQKLLSLSGVGNVAVIVGSQGLGAVSGIGSLVGNAGGVSSFGTYCSATGGGNGSTPSGGASGFGIGGDVNSGFGAGGCGMVAAVSGTNVMYATGSGGGGGANGTAVTSRADGGDARCPGGGGSGGGSSDNAAVRGGNGAAGQVIIEW